MKSKSNRFWAALLAGILLLCAAAIFYISTRGPKGPVAVIYSGGQEVRRIDLGAVTEDETFVLTGFGGLSNTVEVSEGKSGAASVWRRRTAPTRSASCRVGWRTISSPSPVCPAGW